MQRISIPEFFNNLDPYPYNKISVDDITLIEYRQCRTDIKSEILLNANMVILLLKGKKHFRFHEKDYCLEKGGICFLKKGNYIASELFTEEEGFYEALQILISDEFIKDFVNTNPMLFDKPNDHEVLSGCFIFSLSPFLKSTIESLFPIFAYEHDRVRDILKLKIHELFFNLLQADKHPAFNSMLKLIANESTGNLASVMESNYTKPYRLEDFARLTFKSLSKFKNDFKKVYNVPPKEWINTKRLERARLLLMNGQHDVTEVSFLVGFENYSHFIQLFRKKYKCTPKQYSKISQ
jgi:AraC-like DNA-binding protein